MVVLDAECSHDRDTRPDGVGEARDKHLRMSPVRDAARRLRLLAKLRRHVQFDPLHHVVERCLPCEVENRHGDVDEVRQRADDRVCAASPDRHRNFRDRYRLPLHAHEPAIGVIQRAVDDDLYAVVADKVDERAHAASSFWFNASSAAVTSATFSV